MAFTGPQREREGDKGREGGREREIERFLSGLLQDTHTHIQIKQTEINATAESKNMTRYLSVQWLILIPAR